MKQIAVLGCGPSGLLAAHAVALQGLDPVIYSVRQKSRMGGAQYVHNPIPDLTSADPDGMLEFQKIGTKEGYAAKVYGSETAATSWDIFPEGAVPAWQMLGMYDELWEMYSSRIIDLDIRPSLVHDIKAAYGVVLSTVPLRAICERPDVHEFRSKTVWFRTKGDIPTGKNLIIYNGDPHEGWYRFSSLWGHLSYEFGHPVRDAFEGIKPLHNDCTCHEGITRLGRFGKWQKGVLVTDAFQEARNAMQQV